MLNRLRGTARRAEATRLSELSGAAGPLGSGSIDEAALEGLLDLLIEGRYHAVPEGSDRLTTKIHQLARTLEGRGLAHLKDMVAVSVATNEAVTDIAGMLRAVTEVNHRTQAIAASTEELVASVQEIGRHAEMVADDARLAHQATTSGEQAADRAVGTMEEIADAVRQAAQKVDSLAEASSQIGTIVDQIEAIAKQTNLLSLNASIEAARAGEAGKGFAVVANEVKSLANQTARATVDIRARIENLRHEMAEIVETMERGSGAVEQGRTVIGESGAGMRDVARQVSHAAEKIQEISVILTQQGVSATEVSEGISSIAASTAENVSMIGAVMGVLDRAEDVVTKSVPDLMTLELTDKTVHIAKSDHMIWRKRLANMLANRVKLNPKELADHHQCRLGKWYDALGDSGLRAHPAFAALEGPHRDVHAFGIKAAECHQRGDINGALENVAFAGAASIPVMFYLDRLLDRGAEGKGK